MAPTTPNMQMVESANDDSSQDDSFATQQQGEDAPYFQNQVLLAKGDYLIVGIRYYQGVAHPGEYVYLVREPSNPYDRNAIRVDNVHHQKIGHIKGTQCCKLAPLMDQYGEGLKIEGTIPCPGTAWNLPVSLEFNSTLSEPAQTMALAKDLKHKLKHSCSQFRMEPNVGGSVAAVVTPATVTPEAVIQTQALDWNQQQKQLDDIFEKQLESQLKDLPNLEMPSAFKSKLKLFDYQIQGIRFLVQKERNPPPAPFFRKVKEQGKTMHLCEITQSSQANPPSPIKGSLLCDEMGLGKSLQALGLILLEPKAGVNYNAIAIQPPSSIVPEQQSTAENNSHNPSLSMIQSTNNVTLKQILKAAKLKTSGNKKALVERIAQGLTSNAITREHFPESMFQQPPKSAPLVPTPQANHTSKNNGNTNKCTLIVCPVTVMANWTHQVQDHVQEGVLSLKLYHGNSRQKILRKVLDDQVDILLVSYHTLAADYAKAFTNSSSSTVTSGSAGEEPVRKKAKTQSIFDISFHRIILDEAHTIRNPKARPFKAVSEIQAARRLAITGTPFVNRSQDIYSLLSFLQVEPLNQSEIFQRAISKPLQNGQEIGLTRLRTIMGFVSLRRSKQNIPGLTMVDKTVNLATVEFGNDIHKQVYDALYGTLRVAMTAILKDNNNALGNYYNIFEKLLRLRQACCSGLLLTKERREAALQIWKQVSSKSREQELSPEEGLKLLEKLKGEFTQALPECGICLEEFDQTEGTILKGCGHVFCNNCIKQVLERSNQKCPYCRQKFRSEDIVSMVTAKAAANKAAVETLDEGEEFGTPPKIRALLQTIGSTVKPDEKAVIFSQFTSYLDIIGSAMKDAGHEFVRIDGSVPSSKRIERISQFTQDGGPRFILCSLLASGVGINLSRGNHAFLMDCWWNEAIESQAMDRIHRIDQTRPVQVTKFIMKESIEERIVSLQQTKSLRAKGAMQKLTGNEKRQALLGDLKGLLEIGN
ncbi:unnamed protein product [Cylindrotheca closterium]|uniref:Anaphase-promoting complex subunit 11 n=1 Tax=Cylindrotheca closterium TaxID=2856 RepID=A0AAD2JMM0_9STRA|nr:unnamed protein product [Cylindrotheca closterium]